MATGLNQSGSTGRYIVYSSEVDKITLELEKKIHGFQEKKFLNSLIIILLI